MSRLSEALEKRWSCWFCWWCWCLHFGEECRRRCLLCGLPTVYAVNAVNAVYAGQTISTNRSKLPGIYKLLKLNAAGFERGRQPCTGHAQLQVRTIKSISNKFSISTVVYSAKKQVSLSKNYVITWSTKQAFYRIDWLGLLTPPCWHFPSCLGDCCASMVHIIRFPIGPCHRRHKFARAILMFETS